MTEPPEWVFVWFFMRWTLNDWRTLPQQRTGDPATVSMADYEQARNVWLAADSPKPSVREILGAFA